LIGGIADQFEDVGALDRVAAGEDEDGHAHGGDLVDQRLALGVGEFVGMGDGLGCCAAVLAGQIAGLRDLPDGEKGGLVEVQLSAVGNVVHRLHEASSRIGVCWPGRERTFVIKVNQDSADKMVFPVGDHHESLRQGPLNGKTALERHDSVPEEQPWHRTGCDLDHFIWLNRQARPSPTG
jgi:hypothetical protein